RMLYVIYVTNTHEFHLIKQRDRVHCAYRNKHGWHVTTIITRSAVNA
ncbi:hypothetical protein SSYM_1975, partial [Serratia symbiotica str. Tucson]